MSESRRKGIGEAALLGALAGVAGGVALMLAEKAEQKLLLPEGASTPGMGQKLVQQIARDRGAHLSGMKAQAAGAGVQIGYCALLGSLLGVVASRVDAPAVVDGLAMAGLSYALTMPKGGLLPRLGADTPPELHSIEETAVPVGAHLAFGLTTAAVLDAVTG